MSLNRALLAGSRCLLGLVQFTSEMAKSATAFFLVLVSALFLQRLESVVQNTLLLVGVDPILQPLLPWGTGQAAGDAARG